PRSSRGCFSRPGSQDHRRHRVRRRLLIHPSPAAPRTRPAHRDGHRFAPVFILTSARSCSSVITSMIGQHPDLFGMPELKLFVFRTIGELDASLPAEARRLGFAHRSPGLVRAVAELEYGAQNTTNLAAAIPW